MNDLDDAFDRAMRLRGINPTEAARLLRYLAEREDLDAAYHLGILLRERAPHEAVMWFAVVANSGDAEAALNLGCLLVNSGHAEDAAKWFQYAARDADVAIAGLAAYNLGELLRQQGRPADAMS